MTAFTKTVSNSLNIFGCPSDHWNAFTWNNFNWGSGTADLPVQVRHLVTNTLSPTEDSIGHAVRHLVTNALSPTEDSIGHAVRHLVTNTLAPIEDSIGHAVRHLVTNTLAPIEDIAGKRTIHLIANTFSITDSEAVNFVKNILNALAATEDVSALYVQDPNGYFHVFPENVTNVHNQSRPNWAVDSPQNATWSTAVAGSTPWSN